MTTSFKTGKACIQVLHQSAFYLISLSLLSKKILTNLGILKMPMVLVVTMATIQLFRYNPIDMAK